MTYVPHPTASQPPTVIDPRFPLYGATFGRAISRSFAHIFKFSGQASRSEFWWAMLFFAMLRLASYLQLIPLAAIGSLAEEAGAASIDAQYVPSLLAMLTFFALNTLLFVATLSAGWRRLTDAGLAGGLTFLSFIPLGGLVVFVMALMPSKVNLPAPPLQTEGAPLNTVNTLDLH